MIKKVILFLLALRKPGFSWTKSAPSKSRCTTLRKALLTAPPSYQLVKMIGDGREQEEQMNEEHSPALIRLKTHGTFCGPSSLSAQQSSWAFRWVEVRKASCSRKIEETFLSLWATVVCWTSLRWLRSLVVVGDVFDSESIQWNWRFEEGTLSTVHWTGAPLSGLTTTWLLLFTVWRPAAGWCEFGSVCFENNRLSLWAWLCTWWWTLGESKGLSWLLGAFDEAW